MRFDHVGINVGALAEMRDWYVAALGLEVEFEFALTEFGFSGAMLRSPDGYRVELLHREGNVPGIGVSRPMDAALTRGLGHLALTVDDLSTTHASLLALGATERMPPSPSPEPGVRISFVSDPEGNLIELLDRTHSPVEPGEPLGEPVSRPGDPMLFEPGEPLGEPVSRPGDDQSHVP
jgi:catechol 2,3-dioxygenase-like lactoylglutathione lyase family enzyme